MPAMAPYIDAWFALLLVIFGVSNSAQPRLWAGFFVAMKATRLCPPDHRHVHPAYRPDHPARAQPVGLGLAGVRHDRRVGHDDQGNDLSPLPRGRQSDDRKR